MAINKKNANYKLKQRIGRTIMEDELQGKHHEKKNLKKDIKAPSIQLKSFLNVLIYSVLFHKINIAVRSRSNAVSKYMIRNFLIYVNKKTNEVSMTRKNNLKT